MRLGVLGFEEEGSVWEVRRRRRNAGGGKKCRPPEVRQNLEKHSQLLEL